MLSRIQSQGVPLSAIAEKLAAPVVGDAGILISGICSIDAPQKGALTFTKQRSIQQDLPRLQQGGIAALIVPIGCAGMEQRGEIACLAVSDPLAAMVTALPFFFQEKRPFEGISPHAYVDPTVKLGKNVAIGPFAFVGADCVIEDDVIVHPHATIYPGVRIGARSEIHSQAAIREFCQIGSDCILQNGAVIGADGFGYYPEPSRGLAKVPQAGIVKLDAMVEVGASSAVDRATLGVTSVGRGSKIDNQVQIGHNVQIGAYTIVCGGANIAGSTKIGNQVVIGGSSAITGHITIGDGVRIAGHSGVISDILEKGDYAGYPHQRAFAWRRQSWSLTKLPALLKRLGVKNEGEESK